jgi:hypothetical protein
MIAARSSHLTRRQFGWGGFIAVLALIARPLPAAEKKAETVKGPTAAAPASANWKSMFDGKTLAGWKQTGFDGEGAVKVEIPFRDASAAIVIGAGDYLSGITWVNGAELPRMNYEVQLEVMKTEGRDFFCGLTFPVGKSDCTFIAGGWGGSVVGLSSVDHSDASDNDTSTSMDFVTNRWYRIRVRVTPMKIEAWIDDTNMVDLETAGRTIGLRFGDVDKSLPFGIATYQTAAAVRDIRIRRL